jgi:hypothetical protein
MKGFRLLHPGLAVAVATVAACGPAATASRATVPGVDPLSGKLAAVDVDLAGADLSSVRGPAGTLLTNAAVEAGRIVGGQPPDCSLRRLSGGTQAALSARCAAFLGAYAALDRARSFLLSAGAEALPPAPVLADPALRGEAAPAGLRYLPALDAFTLVAGPPGARVPAALNPGAVAHEAALRQLRGLLEPRPDDAAGVALFLGATASGDAAYRAASAPEGDPRGELDLSRPLPPDAPPSDVLAGALWAWADASGDTVGAARAALAAARAVQGSAGADGGSGPATLLSLVAGQLVGAERDQACAVFRARAAGRIPACP